MSTAIGGNDVCSISLVCNLYSLPVASLTARLNIVPITEKFFMMSHESSIGNGSGYYRNLGSLSVGHYELCRDDIGDLPGSPEHL